MIYCVKDYGAAADGKTVDTQAIQSAIDACAQQGGGRVFVPAGKYLVGKIILKDNVTLELGEGAELVASGDVADYPATYGIEDSILNRFQDERTPRRAVLYACSAKNIAVVGRGSVDCCHHKFLVKKNDTYKQGRRFINYMYDDEVRFYARAAKEFVWRPLLIFFEDCENVLVQGVTFKNAPCYTLQLRSSRNINIRDITIRNYVGADNADGIHFSSCSDVRITNCDLECGDDCIAIDSNVGTPSEHYVIDNCMFVSRNNCFRIYTSLAQEDELRKALPYGRVSDVAISNCVVKDASSFVYVNVDTGIVERVSVCNASGTIKRLGTTFLITAHSGQAKQITFANWNFRSRGVGYIYSDREGSISGVTLDNLNIEVCPKSQLYGNGLPVMPTYDNGLPHYWMSHYVPYFLQIICAEDITTRGLSISWGESDIADIGEIGNIKRGDIPAQWPLPVAWDAHWPAIQAKNVKKLVLDGFTGKGFQGHPYAVELSNVEKVCVYRSELSDGEILKAE